MNRSIGRFDKMTIRVVMGTALSGKTYFIKKQFHDSEILSVGDYQRRLKAEKMRRLSNQECK